MNTMHKLILPFRRLVGKVYNKAFKPYTIQESIHITQEDIDKDLHEGRE